MLCQDDIEKLGKNDGRRSMTLREECVRRHLSEPYADGTRKGILEYSTVCDLVQPVSNSFLYEC